MAKMGAIAWAVGVRVAAKLPEDEIYVSPVVEVKVPSIIFASWNQDRLERTGQLSNDDSTCNN